MLRHMPKTAEEGRKGERAKGDEGSRSKGTVLPYIAEIRSCRPLVPTPICDSWNPGIPRSGPCCEKAGAGGFSRDNDATVRRGHMTETR